MEKKQKQQEEAKIKQVTQTQGNVKISFIKGDKEKKFFSGHNTGTINLCNYLRDALVAKSDIFYRRPGNLIPCEKDGESLKDIINIPIPSQKIEVVKSGLADDQSGAVVTFKLEGDLINGKIVSGFKLLSSDSSLSEYATIDISNIDGNDYSFSVNADTDVKVEWTLIISCK